MTTTTKNTERPTQHAHKTTRCPAHTPERILQWIRNAFTMGMTVRLTTPNGSRVYTWTATRAAAQAGVRNPTPPFEIDESGTLWMNHRRSHLRITDRWLTTKAAPRPRHRHQDSAAARRRRKAAGGNSDRRPERTSAPQTAE